MNAANAAHGEIAVRLEGVRFGWGEGDALLDIDYFEVRRGERILVQGASGSGKTTLLGLLGGVLVPQRGRVDVAGTRISALGAAARDRFRADHIGFVFQQFNLLPYLSVRENILLPLAFSRRRAAVGAAGQVETLLTQLGLDARAVSDRPVTELSIGQQQRVAVARALIGAPELLIADEPTSALDADAREAFLRVAFAECARVGATLVFVSHDRGLVPLFDRAIALDDINHAAKNRSTRDARLAAGA